MWRSGQVVAIADQIAFIRDYVLEGRYAGSWRVVWVDCIGQIISMEYSDEALRANGNLPGVDRLAVEGAPRVCRLPVQEGCDPCTGCGKPQARGGMYCPACRALPFAEVRL